MTQSTVDIYPTPLALYLMFTESMRKAKRDLLFLDASKEKDRVTLDLTLYYFTRVMREGDLPPGWERRARSFMAKHGLALVDGLDRHLLLAMGWDGPSEPQPEQSRAAAAHTPTTTLTAAQNEGTDGNPTQLPKGN